jgi:hypothetical protein
MADIFNEIDEELRQERLRKAWDRWGVLILAAAALVVIGVAAWRGWDHWQTVRARAEGDAFAVAEEIAQKGDHQAAEQAFLALTRESAGGYPLLAGLRAAATLAEGGDPAAALAAFDGLAGNDRTPALLADLARVRAAHLAIDLEDRATFEARVAAFDGPARPYRHQARELLVLSAWKAGDFDAARARLAAIEQDPETPRSLLDRAAVLSALVRAHTPAGKAN